MLTILHGADFHLDAPFSSLPPERAAQRRSEQRALPGRLADLARDRGADLVLLPGDLLDGEDSYRETAQALALALGNMGCPVFIAPGNHDFYSPRSPYASADWPENVHIFRSPQIQSVELPGLNCVVHGAAFTAPFRDDCPLAGFTAPDDGRIHLKVLHADVDGRGRYSSLPAADIAASGLDYLALGHIHACTGVRRAGGVCWAYPGCPEGRGFDELGEKGVLLGTVSKGGAELDFVPTAARRYEIFPLDVTDREPADALRDFLPAQPSPDICRILLTGERGVEGLDLEGLEALAAPAYYSVSVRDKTVVRRDLWQRAGEDNLTGLFLRRMRARLDAAGDEQEAALVEQAVRFGLAALENGEDCCP